MRRLGEPVIRTAVGRAMREMGAQFVLGQTIDKARGARREQEKKGYTLFLRHARRGRADRQRRRHLFQRLCRRDPRLAAQCRSADIRDNPGISIKLSALHPRYEEHSATA